MVTRHGMELAAIVPVAEVALVDRLRALLEKKDSEAAVDEIRGEGTRPWRDVRRELDL